jgi:aminoglycoside phosphotransferase (APT) family kinase protein
MPGTTTAPVRAALRRLYETGPRPASRLAACKKIAEGWECDVFSFVLETGSGRKRRRQLLILKIYLGDRADEKSRREHDFLALLGQAGAPVPSVLRSGDGASPLGRPFLVLERIEGRLAGEVFDEAAPEDRPPLVTLFCRLLIDLHALDWRPFAAAGWLSFPADDPFAFVRQELSVLESKIERFGKREFLTILGWLRDRGARVPCRRLSVLHGDYHESNVLLRPDGAPVIIDWGGAGIGDARNDLAWTLLLVGAGQPPGVREMVLAEYERLAGAQVEDLDLFDVLVAARRLLHLSIARSHGAAALGMRPGAEVRMMAKAAHLKDVHDLLRRRTDLAIPEIERLLAGSAA